MHDPTAFERFLLVLSARLAALPASEVDGALDAVLRDIGEALGTDRTALLEFAGAGVTHVWARPGHEAAIPKAPLPAELPWYHDTIARGEVVALAHVETDLPPTAEPERDFARAAGLKSHLAVPIAVGGRLVCALTTSTFRHYCAWSAPLIDRFRLVGQIVAQAIDRARADTARTAGAESRRPGGLTRGRAPMRRLDEVEREYIEQVIDRCDGKINGRGHAAEILGLHPNTLRSRMKKLGIRWGARSRTGH
jgi:transcriptional regulator with GAF, ATPase, and Fis domain